jgi:hypothetical protein
MSVQGQQVLRAMMTNTIFHYSLRHYHQNQMFHLYLMYPQNQNYLNYLKYH